METDPETATVIFEMGRAVVDESLLFNFTYVGDAIKIETYNLRSPES
jgi:hypothetical protein